MTAVTLGVDYEAQWYDMSVFDSSMRLTIDVNDQSRLLAEFMASVAVSNSAVWFRIVIDGAYISTVCYLSTSPGSNLPVQVKLLTGALSAGQHTIDVQFYRVTGVSKLLDRSLYATELPLS